jgi:hypothetical protein
MSDPSGDSQHAEGMPVMPGKEMAEAKEPSPARLARLLPAKTKAIGSSTGLSDQTFGDVIEALGPVDSDEQNRIARRLVWAAVLHRVIRGAARGITSSTRGELEFVQEVRNHASELLKLFVVQDPRNPERLRLHHVAHQHFLFGLDRIRQERSAEPASQLSDKLMSALLELLADSIMIADRRIAALTKANGKPSQHGGSRRHGADDAAKLLFDLFAIYQSKQGDAKFDKRFQRFIHATISMIDPSLKYLTSKALRQHFQRWRAKDCPSVIEQIECSFQNENSA